MDDQSPFIQASSEMYHCCLRIAKFSTNTGIMEAPLTLFLAHDLRNREFLPWKTTTLMTLLAADPPVLEVFHNKVQAVAIFV